MEKLNIQKQLDSFTNKRLPYWEDFPDFELYMDQLVNLGNRYLTGFLEAPLTPSMINSYVKKGLMSRPVKKKYNATHLAELLVISLLKSVYPLETIKNYNEQLLHELSIKESYNSFAQTFNQALQNGGYTKPLATGLSLSKLTKHVIVNAVIYKMVGEHLLQYKSKHDHN